MSETRQTNEGCWISSVGITLGLLLLLAAPLVHLDRRPLSRPEANFAERALSPLEGESRTLPGPAFGGGPDRLLRLWALVVGTTERPLKLLVVLSFLLSALVTGEAASRLGGPVARPVAYLAHAAVPLLGQAELLQPGSLLILPVGLGLAFFASALGGSFLWLLPGAAGLLMAPFLGSPGPLMLGISALLAAAFFICRCSGRQLSWKLRLGGVGLLLATSLGLLAFLEGPRTRVLQTGVWSLCVPFVALLLGLLAGRLGRLGSLFLLLSLLALAGLNLRPGPKPHQSQVLAALAAARVVGAPGGRLVVFGPDRMGILYYSRRGHEPRMPILSLPEDGSFKSLAALIRHAFGIKAGGLPVKQPPVLIWPRPKQPPGGFHMSPIPSTPLTALKLLKE